MLEIAWCDAENFLLKSFLNDSQLTISQIKTMSQETSTTPKPKSGLERVAELKKELNDIDFIAPTLDSKWTETLQQGLSKPLERDIQVAISNTVHQIGGAIESYQEETTKQIWTMLEELVISIRDHLVNNEELEALRSEMLGEMNKMAGHFLQIQAQAGSSTSTPSQPQVSKMDPPPLYSGTDGKVTFEEWFNKVTLWFANQPSLTDHRKISLALSRLTESAGIYSQPWISLLEDKSETPKWEEFISELKAQYGNKDQKEVAKREITALFANKSLAAENFVKYAERFRTLGRMVGYEDELLIDKLDHVIDKDMRLVLAGYAHSRTPMPEKWKDYLDMLLSIYKTIHKEKTEGHIFGRTKVKDNSVPMDVDNVDKKKKKKNKKEVNSTDKSNKYCHICKMKGHNTDECNFNKKGKQPQTSEKKKEGDTKKGGKSDFQKKKKIRVIEVSASESEASDDEKTTPVASSSKTKINSAELKHAYIEEVESDDEPPTPPSPVDKGKGKTKRAGGKDFLWGNM